MKRLLCFLILILSFTIIGNAQIKNYSENLSIDGFYILDTIPALPVVGPIGQTVQLSDGTRWFSDGFNWINLIQDLSNYVDRTNDQSISGEKTFQDIIHSTKTFEIGGSMPGFITGLSGGQLFKNSTLGVVLMSSTGASTDFALTAPNGISPILVVPTGTVDLLASGTYKTLAVSPLGSSPGGVDATVGTVLTADGSGGSVWDVPVVGAPTLQEVVNSGSVLRGVDDSNETFVSIESGYTGNSEIISLQQHNLSGRILLRNVSTGGVDVFDMDANKRTFAVVDRGRIHVGGEAINLSGSEGAEVVVMDTDGAGVTVGRSDTTYTTLGYNTLTDRAGFLFRDGAVQAQNILAWDASTVYVDGSLDAGVSTVRGWGLDPTIARFGHTNFNNSALAYGYLQDDTGSLFVSAADTKTISQRINNVEILGVSSLGVGINGNLTLGVNDDRLKGVRTNAVEKDLIHVGGDNHTYINMTSDDVVIFGDGSEKIRVRADGGKVTGNLEVTGEINSPLYRASGGSYYLDTGGFRSWTFDDVVGTLNIHSGDGNGFVYFNTDVTTSKDLNCVNLNYSGALIDVSDKRVKENIEPLNFDRNKFKKINFFKYNYKVDSLKGIHYNPLAQDLELLYPESVIHSKTKIVRNDSIILISSLSDEEKLNVTNEDRLHTIKPMQLSMISMNGLKSEMIKNDSLKLDIEVLKSLVKNLGDRLDVLGN